MLKTFELDYEKVSKLIQEKRGSNKPGAERDAYLRQMEQERGYLLDFHRILAEHDLDFLKKYNELLATAYTSPRLLDARTKEMVITAVIIALGSSRTHIVTHLKLLKKMGVTAQEALEFIEILMPPAGVPVFMNAVELWREVWEISA
jgi:4-carboxymuconolactone decarboxylase